MNKVYREISRVSAERQVVLSISQAVETGKLKLGDRLPNETDLAGELGVGRSSLREGVRTLSAYGLLEVRQGEGTFVSDQFANKIFDFWGFTPSKDNYLRLMEFRKVLECGCIYNLYSKITPERCAELRRLSLQLSSSADVKTNIDADRAFHEKLFIMSDNFILLHVYQMMSKMLQSLMTKLLPHGDIVEDARASHLRIVDALTIQDRDAALEAMDDHLERICYYLDKY